jgi:ABC-2 type transport system permease protein
VNSLEGTGRVLRFLLRRDRVRLSVWVLSLVAITAASARAVSSTYNTPLEIAAYARNMGNSPVTVAMAGPPVALETIQGIVVYETSLTVLIGAALMATFTVVRHTRGEEEVGRTELLASTSLGRHAGTAAAVLLAAGASLLVGLGVTASVAAVDFSIDQAVLYGASVVALGLVFAGVAATAAQLVGHARTAVGLTLAVLGTTFALRAVGDVRGDFLTWLSPIGWSQQVRLVEADRWWPLALSVALTAVLLVMTGWLSRHRDVGSGVMPGRPGPPVAAPGLRSPLGLTWRLQRGSVWAWGIGLFLLGAVFGSVSNELQDMVRDNPTLQQYFEATGGDVTDALFVTALLFSGLGAGGFAVSSVLRLHAEESSGRLEPMLATALSRYRALLSPLLVTIAGAAVLVTAGGLGVAVADALVRDDFGSVARLTALSWVQLPAVLVLVGVAVLLVGWLPRATALAWALVGIAFVVGWLGGLLSLPGWVSGLSPYDHLPLVPVDDLAVAPLVALTLLGVALTAAGAVGFRRRDIG